jgi:hypothetical protein
MRALFASLVLAAGLTAPLSAQAPARFLKVDIIAKSNLAKGHHQGQHSKGDGPSEVHVRTPIALAKSLLACAGESEIKVNGENRKGLKTDELVKLLETSKSGDMLLELTTDQGDHITITLE